MCRLQRGPASKNLAIAGPAQEIAELFVASSPGPLGRWINKPGGRLANVRQVCYDDDNDEGTGRNTMKREAKIAYVKPRGHYVVNQKAPVFADRRTKRLRTRGAQKRHEIGLAS